MAAAIGFLMLGACDKSSPAGSSPARDVAAAEATSVGEFVQAGKKEACSHADVQRLIIEQVQPGELDFKGQPLEFSEEDLGVAKQALPPSTLSNFQSISWQQNTSTMECQVEIASPFHSAQRKYQFQLKGSKQNRDGFALNGNFKMARAVAAAELQSMAWDLSHARGPLIAETNVADAVGEPSSVNLSADDQLAADAPLKNSESTREPVANAAPDAAGNDSDWERPSINNEL